MSRRALVAVVLMVAACAPSPYARSPRWAGDRFANPSSWPRHPGAGAFMRWSSSGRPPLRPRGFAPPRVDNDGALLRARAGMPAVASLTWIGHATVLVQAGGLTLLTDPNFSRRVGFFDRLAPPGVALDRLPPVDVVLISHDHRDHLDEASVLALAPSVRRWVVPLGIGPWLRARGARAVVELDWWQSAAVVTPDGRGARITLVPAQHWGRRGAFDEEQRLWGGFVVDAGGRRIYFAGDTGYPGAFREIGARFPGIDYALVPIGAYAPRWFMRSQHIDPAEAALVFQEVGARRLVPIHWGTFHLSDEPMDEPPRELRRHVDAGALVELAIGETFWEPVAAAPITR